MKCIELNREGKFDQWDHSRLSELHNHDINKDENDKYTIYQNDYIKLSVFVLESYERLPFSIIKNDFDIISLTGGMAITRFSHGGISLLMFEKGETVKYTLKNSKMVNDFQNIGEALLIMALIEYKKPDSKVISPLRTSELENTAVVLGL